MKFFTRLFKRKPKGTENYGLVQYLDFQTQELLFVRYRFNEKKITEQDYILSVDEIISKMQSEIHNTPHEEPEWTIPKKHLPAGRHGRRRKKS